MTERREEKRWQGREKERHIVQGFFTLLPTLFFTFFSYIVSRYDSMSFFTEPVE